MDIIKRIFIMKKTLIGCCLAIVTLLSTVSFANTKSLLNSTPIEQAVSTQLAIIDLNTASPKALLSLKGIGKKKAQAIIEYRKEHGNFTSINELTNVQGIGKQVVSENLKRLKI